MSTRDLNTDLMSRILRALREAEAAIAGNPRLSAPTRVTCANRRLDVPQACVTFIWDGIATVAEADTVLHDWHQALNLPARQWGVYRHPLHEDEFPEVEQTSSLSGEAPNGVHYFLHAHHAEKIQENDE